MLSLRTCLLVGAAVLAAGASSAENIALRASPAGVDHVRRLISALPEDFTLPEVAMELDHCAPSSQMVIHEGAELSITWHEFDLEFVGDELVATAVVDLVGSGPVDGRDLACFIDVSCDVLLTADQLRISTTLDFMTDADGTLALLPRDPTIDTADLTAFDIEVDGCLLGEAADYLFDALDRWIADDVSSALAENASAGIAERFSDIAMPRELNIYDYSIHTSFTEASIDHTGVAIAADSQVFHSGGVAPASAVAIDSPTEPAFSGPPTSKFELAVADTLVTSALNEVWFNGYLGELIDWATPTYVITEGVLIDRLGLPVGTAIKVRVDLGGQPSVHFGRASADEAMLVLPDLTVAFDIDSPGSPSGTLEILTTARVSAGFRIGSNGALMVQLRDLALDRLALGSGDLVVETDLARLEQMVEDVVTPILESSLGEIPLAPALSPMPDLHVWIRDMTASGGWLRTSLDLYSRDPLDREGPETTLEERRYVRAGLATMDVSGVDDSTPQPLLRYLAWIDNESVFDDPVHAHAVRLPLEDGEYEVKVAAVDLNENVDPTPARIILTVDGEEPTLVVDGGPSSIIPHETFGVSWSATDDRTEVKTRWEVFELNSGGSQGVVVASGSAGAAGEAVVKKLKRKRVYVLRVTAEDEAGNVTSQEFGFGYEQGACSAGGGSSWPVAVLFALALFSLRRRERSCAG